MEQEKNLQTVTRLLAQVLRAIPVSTREKSE